MALHYGAMGWSAVCDCGISWSYSLTFALVPINVVSFWNATMESYLDFGDLELCPPISK